MKTLTVISPVYQEAELIREFYTTLKAELSHLSLYDARILFVVDRGRDQTLHILKDIAKKDLTTSVLGLSSRFGHQMSLLAGIDYTHADVIIMMDSDLQHPPSVIPKLLAAYERGNDVVYTIREDTRYIGFFRRYAAKFFYLFVNLLSEVPIHGHASDFRLISQRVATIIRTQIRERDIFLRGIISWMGFNQTAVRFVAQERKAGKSKYSFGRLIQFASFGIISFSKKPLRAAIIVGALFALVGFIVAIITIVQSLTSSSLPAGWATVVVLLSIFGGVQLIFLGVLGEYIGAIFDEVKRRPHYIVEDSVNIKVKR